MNDWNLLFAKGQVPRIDVCLLEQREEELAGSSIVRVGSSEEKRKLEAFVRFHGGGASVIRSIVKDDNGVASPAFPLLVQLVHQLTEEQVHHLSIAVALGEREVSVPKIVNTHNLSLSFI